MPILPIGVPVNSVRPRGPEGGDAAWRTRVEDIEGERQTFRARSAITEADLIFRRDAARLGYLDKPRGLAAYYRAFGMLPPRYLAEDLPRIEFTNFDLNLVVDRSHELERRAEMKAARSV